MAHVYTSPSLFQRTGLTFTRTKEGSSAHVSNRRFRSLFGVTPFICFLLWTKMSMKIPLGATPVHLLWALIFLKIYVTEHVNRGFSGADEKKFRKWCWVFIEILSNISLLKWENRIVGGSTQNCYVSIDGTDFPIVEPTPFDAKWYSHKFKDPGVRYEICVCIGTGNIVWAHGPFPCGRYPDVNIFRQGIKKLLLPGEKVIADGGYGDLQCVTPKNWPTGSSILKKNGVI